MGGVLCLLFQGCLVERLSAVVFMLGKITSGGVTPG